MRHSPTIGGFPQYKGGKFEETEYTKCVLVVYCVLENEIDQL